MTVGTKNVRGRMVTEYPAGGTPKGLTIYFLWSYSREDRSDYRDFLKPQWNIIRTRYIGLLTGKGYKVLSVWRATREDMMVAHHNPRSAGVYIDAHGSAGKVRSSDGKWFAPRDLNPRRVSRKLKWAVYAVCEGGKLELAWRKAFGHPVVLQVWRGDVDQSQIKDFLTTNHQSFAKDLMDKPHGGIDLIEFHQLVTLFN